MDYSGYAGELADAYKSVTEQMKTTGAIIVNQLTQYHKQTLFFVGLMCLLTGFAVGYAVTIMQSLKGIHNATNYRIRNQGCRACIPESGQPRDSLAVPEQAHSAQKPVLVVQPQPRALRSYA